MNSFHAKMNEKTLVATRPGATSGNRIRQKMRAGPAPSIAAASSSSFGTVATKLRQEGVAQLVADAPKISHPIYSAVHVRHHHSHTHVRLLKALKQMTA